MSRNRASKNAGSKFKRLLGWTVLIAIVFSAGLITGERLVRRQALSPLVSVAGEVDPANGQTEDGQAEADADEDEPTSFAFFDQLARKDGVSLSANRKAKEKTEKPAPEPAAAKEEPEEKPKAKPEPQEAAPEKEAPAPEPAEAELEAEPAGADEVDAARYTLQVASHPNMDSARSHMEKLRKMGLEPHVVAGDVPGKGKFYRVRVGKFQSMDEARSFQSDLTRKNSLSTFVSPL
ncbi:MAG: SPOR domain-containing protein [Persicimonas sp.]